MLRAKIVCTIGPASEDIAIIRQLILSGMTVCRLNMSHGTHADHKRRIDRIRQASEDLDRPIALLADLQGPKLRTGIMQEGGVPLIKGETLILTTEDLVGAPGRVPIQYKEMPKSVKPGERILLDDGLLELEVIETNSKEIITRIIIGGVLNNNKGMNLPDASLSIPALSVKDLNDARFAIEQQLDFIALSFVRTDEEVKGLKEFIRSNSPNGREIPVISKIEKPEAVKNLDAIIAASDGIMVARGDLGIETNPEFVPSIQKTIIAKCMQATKPVITATQMLDSMTYKPRPTRAEVSDVANAVLDGTDAVMLSGETANGAFPVEVVQMMARIAAETERVRIAGQHQIKYPEPPIFTSAGAICHSAVQIADEANARVILAPTISGNTARLIAAFRPRVPVIALTPDPVVQRRLCLQWGTTALLSKRMNTTDDVVNDAVNQAIGHKLIESGDRVVVTAGVVSGGRSATNLVMMREVE
ncbi:MAG: pyruvate kinase [Caldilineaceae bacterium]